MQADRLRAVAASLVALFVAARVDAQVAAAPTFVVNSNTINDQFQPGVAADGDGFVVVWAFGPRGQRFDAMGARVGGEFVLSATSGMTPVAGTDRGGALVAVWADGVGIAGRLQDAAGAPVGSEFQIATYTTGSQVDPDVFRRRDGSFVVTWMSDQVDGSVSGIAARMFAADGSPVGDQFVVNTFTVSTQVLPAVGGDAAGNFVVVWNDIGGADGSLSGIFGQRFDRHGARRGGEFRVNVATVGEQMSPSVAVRPDGGFLVTWADNGGLRARRFDESGFPLAGDLTVVNATQMPRVGQEAVSVDDAGNFVVVWVNAFQTLARRLDEAGVPRGTQFAVSSFCANPSPSGLPAVQADAVGNFVVVCEGADGFGRGIFASRFGGLLPAALAVDTGGNGVLEPGETVPVRPSWRSANAAAQTFGSSLSRIGGPAGLTYAITDATADYGTLAPGATNSCTDCFEVSLSDPPSRPQVHIDATALEGVVPDTQGQRKVWSLHVGRSFADVPPTSPSYRFVETLLHAGATAGCRAGDDTLFCPGGLVLRGQMAPMVLTGKEGAGYAPPACATPSMFPDVPADNPLCPWVEELARRGAVGGCGPFGYCPNRAVTRQELAVVLVKTLDPAVVPPPCVPPNIYPDVPETSPYCRWIEELARQGMVADCGGGNYCPGERVTRSAVAEFVTRTFALTLYGP